MPSDDVVGERCARAAASVDRQSAYGLVRGLSALWPAAPQADAWEVANVSQYLRPGTLEEALQSLGRRGAVVVGGGTGVNSASSLEPLVVIDLQGLGLDTIENGVDGRLLLGATTTLRRIVESPRAPQAVREAARREEPSTLGNMATIGGCVAGADPSSELLATLLVHDARVESVTNEGGRTVDLSALLLDSAQLARGVITSISIATDGVTAAARTGRTVADRPIVAAVARRDGNGETRLALTGVDVAPVLMTAANGSYEEAIRILDPPGDFRGSNEYRRELAVVLAKRVLEEIG